jgi:1-acyl-sn-glycerol-3-phosphate acyltransferase
MIRGKAFIGVGGVVARRRLGFLRRFTAMVVKPSMLTLTKPSWSGIENIPADGGVIIVANHVSHFDPLEVSHIVYEAGRWPAFLAKSSLFGIPIFGRYLYAVGQIPVYRGTADAAKSLDAAVKALERGDSLIMYPEGTTTREPDLWPMRGKTGIARLWLRTGAPIVPLVMWGPQRIFDPRTGKLRLRLRTPVAAKVGPPLDLSKWAGVEPTAKNLTELTDHIMLQLRDMVATLRDATPPPLYPWSAAPAKPSKDRA